MDFLLWVLLDGLFKMAYTIWVIQDRIYMMGYPRFDTQISYARLALLDGLHLMD